MDVSSTISFSHSRKQTTKSSSGAITVSDVSFGTLPDIVVTSLAVDKQVVKIYYPFGNTDAVYVTLGMVGPTVKIVGRTANITPWNALFANDILTIEAFDFPTWAVVLAPSSKWWVDIKSKDTQSGRMMKYDISLDLVKLSEV